MFELEKEESTHDQTEITAKKKELGKQTLAVKTRQKEVQTAELEFRKSLLVT